MTDRDKKRDELLEVWDDIYGVMGHYDWQSNMDDDLEVGEEYEAPLVVGITATSLKNNMEETEFIMAWHPMDICEFVEDFLNQYHDLYISHIAMKARGPKKEI